MLEHGNEGCSRIAFPVFARRELAEASGVETASKRQPKDLTEHGRQCMKKQKLILMICERGPRLEVVEIPERNGIDELSGDNNSPAKRLCCSLFDHRYRSGLIASRAYEHVYSIHREIEADDSSRKT